LFATPLVELLPIAGVVRCVYVLGDHGVNRSCSVDHQGLVIVLPGEKRIDRFMHVVEPAGRAREMGYAFGNLA
jgi:hypothetical protein